MRTFVNSAHNRRGLTAGIDNIVFRLNYQATVVLLLVAVAIFLFDGQNAISCTTANERKVPDTVFNDYCLHHHEFSGAAMTSSAEMTDVVSSLYGAGRIYPRAPNYYLYLWPLLLWLAVTFYLPHWLWVNYENGRMTRVVSRICETGQRRHPYREYRVGDPWYGHVYYTCELLNFAVALGQFLAVDAVMGGAGQFVYYGSRYLKRGTVDPEQDPFPLQVACSYHVANVHGRSNIEELCVLPRNALYSKIFFGVWAWLILMISCNSAVLVYRLLVSLCSQSVKRRLLLSGGSSRWGLLGVCFDLLMSGYHDEEEAATSAPPGGKAVRISATDMCQITFLLDNLPWLELDLSGESAGRGRQQPDDDVFHDRSDVKTPLVDLERNETSQFHQTSPC